MAVNMVLPIHTLPYPRHYGDPGLHSAVFNMMTDEWFNRTGDYRSSSRWLWRKTVNKPPCPVARRGMKPHG